MKHKISEELIHHIRKNFVQKQDHRNKISGKKNGDTRNI